MCFGGNVKIKLMLAASLALAVVAQSAVVVARGIWLETAGSRPDGVTEGSVPFSHARINPFAINESGIGKLLADIAIMGSDSVEHMGIPRVSGTEFLTLPAMWLDRLWRSGVPPIHIHASDGEITAVGGSEGDELEMGAAQIAAARQKNKSLVENAYRLNPGNPQALTIILWQRFESAGEDARVDLGSLADYSISVLARDEEHWPEHTLQIASIQIDKWHLAGRPMGEELDALMSELREALDKAEKTKGHLEAIGRWAARVPGAQEQYEHLHMYARNLLRMAESFRSSAGSSVAGSKTKALVENTSAHENE